MNLDPNEVGDLADENADENIFDCISAIQDIVEENIESEFEVQVQYQPQIGETFSFRNFFEHGIDVRREEKKFLKRFHEIAQQSVPEENYRTPPPSPRNNQDAPRNKQNALSPASNNSSIIYYVGKSPLKPHANNAHNENEGIILLGADVLRCKWTMGCGELLDIENSILLGLKKTVIDCVMIPSLSRHKVVEKLPFLYNNGHTKKLLIWLVRCSEFDDYSTALENSPTNSLVVELPGGHQGPGHAKYHGVELAKDWGMEWICLMDDSIRNLYVGGSKSDFLRIHDISKIFSLVKSCPATKDALCVGPNSNGIVNLSYKVTTTRVNQLLFLNIKLMNHENIRFSPSPFMEDMLFFYKCISLGQKVVKARWLAIHTAHNERGGMRSTDRFLVFLRIEEVNPMEEIPVEENAVEENPVEENPVEENAVEENAVDKIPVEEIPVEENSGQKNPAEENPVEENPVEENSVEGNSVEENPVEENPVEENPVEENQITSAAETAAKALIGEFGQLNIE